MYSDSHPSLKMDSYNTTSYSLGSNNASELLSRDVGTDSDPVTRLPENLLNVTTALWQLVSQTTAEDQREFTSDDTENLMTSSMASVTSSLPGYSATTSARMSTTHHRAELDYSGWVGSRYHQVHGSHNIYVLYGAFGIMVLCFVLVVCWVQCRRYCHYGYHRLTSKDKKQYEYIYRPLQGGILDEEYENTFVGVSIPLLQEVTKI